MKEALFYQTENRIVVCGLCAHRCRIEPGRRGICGVRENQDGILYSLAYGRVSAEHVDPVEKKPLYHFLPGSLTCSIATVGCNFKCLHCQNYSLSQLGPQIGRVAHRQRRPQEIVDLALRQDCRSISYTYSEPTIFIEFALDCARLARNRGLKNIFVSNGYMTREAAEDLSSVLDGINIDIKAFSESFYRKTCGGGLQQVLENVLFFFERGVWVELTTLVIPGLNDSAEELRSIADFIASCDPAIPWHVSAFRPTFKMLDRPPTSKDALLRARQIGFAAGLHHVYVGNIVGGGGEDTRCQACGETVIRRHGYSIRQNLMSRNCCPFCSAAISGVW